MPFLPPSQQRQSTEGTFIQIRLFYVGAVTCFVESVSCTDCVDFVGLATGKENRSVKHALKT